VTRGGCRSSSLGEAEFGNPARAGLDDTVHQEFAVDESSWKAFDVDAELEAQRESGRPYREFLRVPALSTGIYTLAAGANDLQGPHDEDEVYYVIRGRGRLRVDDRDVAVGPGSVLYVGASASHSFFEIEEDMTLLVFFATGGAPD
jgi:mannose-6-phosphate isomerase-like protein (cupin superfamily)